MSSVSRALAGRPAEGGPPRAESPSNPHLTFNLQGPPGSANYGLGATSGPWPVLCPALELHQVLHFKRGIWKKKKRIIKETHVRTAVAVRGHSALQPCGETEALFTAGGNGKRGSRGQDSLAGPQKVKCGVTTWPGNSTPRDPPQRKGTCVHTETCTQTFTAA